MISTMMQVVSIETKTSDKGFDYKVVEFRGLKMLGNKEIKTNIVGTRVLFPKHTITKKDGTEVEVKGDALYNDIFIGDVVDGQVCRFNTTQYQLGENLVNQYKCVVFGDENPLVVAAKALAQNNAAPITEEGEIFTLITQKPVTKKNDNSKEQEEDDEDATIVDQTGKGADDDDDEEVETEEEKAARIKAQKKAAAKAGKNG
jgi:hypothetical protein